MNGSRRVWHNREVREKLKFMIVFDCLIIPLFVMMMLREFNEVEFSLLWLTARHFNHTSTSTSIDKSDNHRSIDSPMSIYLSKMNRINQICVLS